MARTRGFITSGAIAAAIILSVFLSEGSLSEAPGDGYSYFLLFAVVLTIVVQACWLIGVVVGWTWHGRVGRLLRHVPPRGQP